MLQCEKIVSITNNYISPNKKNHDLILTTIILTCSCHVDPHTPYFCILVVKLEFTGVHKFWLERVTTIYVSNV